MKHFAKLVDGFPIYAPEPLPVGETLVWNPPEELYPEQGYLPLRLTPQPEDEEGWYFVERWTEEDGEIVQGWERVKAPDDISLDEIAEILLGGAT
jgi:hypothetical protein